jgi:uncharacterized protein involved in cysteine biosynthesis
MIGALSKSLAQMFEPSLRRVLGKVLVATIAVFVVIWLIVGAVITNVTISDIGWLDTLVGWLGGAATFVVSLILFAPLATLVASVFLDEVANAVEAKHYPDLPVAQSQTIGQSVMAGVRLLIWTLLVNLLCLPLYLLPIANIVIFFAVNGLLIGREYYEVVAFRRMSRLDAAAFRRRGRFTFWQAGVVIAVVFWVPLLNLTAPILGTALMVHVFENRRRRLAVN